MVFVLDRRLLVFISNSVPAQLAPVTIKDGKVVFRQSPHETIRLDAQELTVRGDAIDATFAFSTTGSTVTQCVGVRPATGSWMHPSDVKAGSNGKKVAFSAACWDRHARYYKYDERGDSWWTKPLPEWMVAEVVSPQCLTTIRVRYELNWPISYWYSGYWKGA